MLVKYVLLYFVFNNAHEPIFKSVNKIGYFLPKKLCFDVLLDIKYFENLV